MPLHSEREFHHIADISEQCKLVRSFLDMDTVQEFEADSKSIFAVEKAIQNVSESCIRLEGPKQSVNGKKVPSGRFEELFPDYKFENIRRLGNLIRHDYGALDTTELWDTAHDVIPKIEKRADTLLDQYRQLRGAEWANAQYDAVKEVSMAIDKGSQKDRGRDL